MLGLLWRYSASAMYANYDLPNIDTVLRRSLFECQTVYSFIGHCIRFKDYLLVNILLYVLLSSLGL